MSTNRPGEIDLLERLRRLEKSQARYRAAFFATAALAAFLCMTGAKKVEDVVQAKTFQVLNDQGKVMVQLSSANGKGELRTYRADGNPLVSLFSSTDDSGRLECYNADGKPTVQMTTTTTGSGNIVVNSTLGKPSFQLGSTGAKQGGLWIYNADGKTIAIVSAKSGTSDGLAEIFDAAGKVTGHLP